MQPDQTSACRARRVTGNRDGPASTSFQTEVLAELVCTQASSVWGEETGAAGA
jgi:hypothetical protein